MIEFGLVGLAMILVGVGSALAVVLAVVAWDIRAKRIELEREWRKGDRGNV